jgi:hypothetical protein
LDNLHILQSKNKEITNLFKHANVGIDFKNTNTLQQLTKPKTNNNATEHDNNGIYKYHATLAKDHILQRETKMKTMISRTRKIYKTE